MGACNETLAQARVRISPSANLGGSIWIRVRKNTAATVSPGQMICARYSSCSRPKQHRRMARLEVKLEPGTGYVD